MAAYLILFTGRKLYRPKRRMEAGRNLNAPASIIHWLEPRRGFVKQVAHGAVHQWSVKVRQPHCGMAQAEFSDIFFRKFPWNFSYLEYKYVSFQPLATTPGFQKVENVLIIILSMANMWDSAVQEIARWLAQGRLSVTMGTGATRNHNACDRRKLKARQSISWSP